MISSLPSYDDELLNSAYANVSLISDRAWTFDREDPFRKLNRSLWIESRKLTTKYKENANYRPKRVRDVIPDSHLAKYGNYEYNGDREKMYKPDDDTTAIPLPNFCWTEVTEPWMLPEVEKHFTRIISSRAQPNRELSAIKGPRTDDASKVACDFKSRWKDFLPNQHVIQKLSQTEKKLIITSENSKAFERSEPCEKSDERYEHRRYTIENSAEMQLHIRVTSDAVRDLWDLAKAQQQYGQHGMRLQCYQQQQYSNRREQSYQGRECQPQFYYTFQYQPLILRAEYQSARAETYGMTRKHLPPVLSPEVPEFFPKVPVTRFNNKKEQNGNRMQYFPSLNERSYQHELFPYNRTPENSAIYQNTGIHMLPATDSTTFIRPPQHWFQRIPPLTQIQISTSSSPMCTAVQPLRTATITHPLQIQEKFLQSNPTPIPVYQHPVELYHETTQKRKSQGVDFKNLILLTKNAMKAHRGQSKNSQQRPSYVLESRTRNSKPEREVLHWLDKSCPPKTKELTVNALVSELRSFEEKCDYGKASSSWKEMNNSTKKIERIKSETGIVLKSSKARSTNEIDKTDTRTRRRLYRDVLTNASTSEVMLENVFEKRYDELEQQAMEQYRTSEESLALKYQKLFEGWGKLCNNFRTKFQELERQAVEQYRCGGNVVEPSSTSRASADDKQTNDGTKIFKEGCYDGKKCSGFGKCSPTKQGEKTEKGSFQQPQITLLKPENKSGSSVSNRSSSSRNTRSAIASKSLTKLTNKISHGSKNTCKGASGDKIDKNVSVRSSKRRLILVSPFERESEARLTKTTDLEEFYCISQANKNIFNYYDNSKIGKTGGGDENISIIQSPRTEVWLSGFWTA